VLTTKQPTASTAAIPLFAATTSPVLQVTVGQHAFTYDNVYGSGGGDTAANLYPDCVQPLVHGLFKGYNATVFAYGAGVELPFCACDRGCVDQVASGRTGSSWVVSPHSTCCALPSTRLCRPDGVGQDLHDGLSVAA
jgi:hypothetical protein